MEALFWIGLLTLLGVAMIDLKIWRMVSEQRRHNQAIEQILGELRDRENKERHAPNG
jgi:hypothetical protein